MFTVERFNDPKYSRPRYRLRSDVFLSWCVNGYTHGSYKFKRDAVKRAAELNVCDVHRTNRLALADHLEKNVTDKEYGHMSFHNPDEKTFCAAGHAANAGIGGMGWHSEWKNTPTIDDQDYLPSIYQAFGTSVREIFYPRYATRTEIIEELRK